MTKLYCRESAGNVRWIPATATPAQPGISIRLTAPRGEGFPASTEYGPYECSACTDVLLGKQSLSFSTPAGVGVNCPAANTSVRFVISESAPAKINNLSLVIGPPAVPPAKASLNAGTFFRPSTG